MLINSLLLAAAGAATAQTAGLPPQQPLTLERVFQSPSLSGPAPRLAKLSPDGRLVTLLRNRAEDKERYDLWAIDTATGQARMLVDSEKVGTGAEISEAEKMRRERQRIAGLKGITEYSWSPDSRSILLPLDGDLYVATLDGNVRRVTATAETEIDPKVSEAGRYYSFLRNQNLYLIDAATGQERALTTDGGGTLSWGAAEFVAQEEMDRDTGYWWSPDDRYIAVARVDESPVAIVRRAAIGAEGTDIIEQRYPAAGTANAIVDLYVFTPGGKRVKVDLGTDADIYLTRVEWADDGNSLLVQRMIRDQKRLDVLRVDPKTGKSTVLFSETSPTWVNLTKNLEPLADGSLIWSSERSGYSHLYRWEDGKFTQLTRGDWAVSELVGVDEKSKRLYFTGTMETPIEQQLYWVSYHRPAAPVRITETGWYTHAEMNEGATHALISRSNPAQPKQVYLADATGKRLAWIEENRIDADHPYAPYVASHELPTFGTFRGPTGATLHYQLLTPDLEPGKRYPVFFSVYGGPHGQQVTRSWDSELHQYLVDQGWIVFTMDNRGTDHRGTEFENAIYRAMGGAEVEDQLAGLEWLKAQPFVDPERIGVYGWSYGGYMVLKLLEEAPGAFTAGVSGAPVTKWELYDTFYTERYLGHPKTDPQAYASSNVLADTGKIADPLLLLHGMSDDNVVFVNSTALMAKLQQEGTPFELMLYPGAAHSIPGEERKIHMWRTITDFLDRTVKQSGE